MKRLPREQYLPVYQVELNQNEERKERGVWKWEFPLPKVHAQGETELLQLIQGPGPAQ